MRIFEITGFIDKVADVAADPKANPIEDLANQIKGAGHKVQDQVIELLKIDLNIKTPTQKTTTQPAANAQTTTQPAAQATSVQPAPQPQATATKSSV
jgi:hypothetical protein